MSDDEADIQELVNDLNRAPLEAFEAIAENEPCTTDEVATVLDVTESYAWRLCRHLFMAGVVARERQEGDSPAENPHEYRVIENVEVNDDKYLIESQIAVTDNPWRQRCPHGHSSLTTFSESYRCNACERSYDGEPYDAKKVEFPVEDDTPLPKDIHDQVLAELVERCRDPTTEWLRAYKVGIGSPHQVGRVLAEMESDGLVERLGSGGNTGHHWRPTEAGRDKAIEDERHAVLEEGRRQRAAVHPAAIWAFGVVVALLLLLAYAIVGVAA